MYKRAQWSTETESEEPEGRS